MKTFAALAALLFATTTAEARVGCALPFHFCPGCATDVTINVKSGKTCPIRLYSRGGVAGLETIVRPSHGRFGKENETSLAYMPVAGYTGADYLEARLYYELSNGKPTFTILKVHVTVLPK
ncbi:MAG: hypothetical protein HY242_07365 [Afipia sp.]|nr:hypothetical protein [Afipia sp.]